MGQVQVGKGKGIGIGIGIGEAGGRESLFERGLRGLVILVVSSCTGSMGSCKGSLVVVGGGRDTSTSPASHIRKEGRTEACMGIYLRACLISNSNGGQSSSESCIHRWDFPPQVDSMSDPGKGKGKGRDGDRDRDRDKAVASAGMVREHLFMCLLNNQDQDRSSLM